MKEADFRARTKSFALAILRLYSQLPNKADVQIVGRQLVRAGTSIAANYREACRARSKAEFISKIGQCEQEADETMLWLELLKEGCQLVSTLLDELLIESNEIVSILVTMSKKAKRA